MRPQIDPVTSAVAISSTNIQVSFKYFVFLNYLKNFPFSSGTNIEELKVSSLGPNSNN